MDYSLLSDEKLAQLAQQKDADAMENLINRYRNMVASISRSYFLTNGDTEDLIQDGMISVLRAIESYNGKVEFKYYVYKCIKNGIFSAIRRSKNSKNQPLDNYISLSGYVDGDSDKSFILADDNFEPEKNFINNETAVELKNKITSLLTPIENEIFAYYLQGYSYSDISAKLNKNIKSIDNALQRIKKKLTVKLK